MLTRQQKAIIRYCFTEGISAQNLAETYARSLTRIYQIQWEPEFKIFATDDEKSWFLAGVEAALSVQRAKMVVPEPENRLLQAREERRKQRQELYGRRAKNLPNFAQKEHPVRQEEDIVEEEGIVEEEVILEEDDDGDANQAVTRETISRLIIENMLENLSGRRRRYHPMCVKFCYILRSYSAVCYDYMRKILPLPSRQTITTRFKDVERRLTRSYQRPEELDYVIAAYFDRHPLPQMNKPLTCTVSIDAFSISVFRKTKWEESVPEKRIDSSQLSEKSKLEIEIEKVPEQAVVPCLMTESYNNVFLVMLNPLDWSHPPAILSAFCWKNGHADRNIVRCILELIESLKKYNIEVCAIASDGDPGYSCLHDAFAKLWRKKNDDFFVIFNRVFSKPSKVRIDQARIASRAAPIADPLHALKIARSRILDHVVFLARNVKVSDKSLKRFRDKDWFKDRSQLAKLSDYYALSMFDAETLLSLCEEEEFAAAIYLWPWVSLCLVIRSPSLSLDCRRSLLHGTFIIMQFFYNQDLRTSFGEARVTARAMRGCDGISFFEPSYLVRVLHLILCMYHVLLNHNERLRMSALGSHINENIIGRIRVASHGNPRYEIVQRAISKAEVRRLLQAELGAEHTVRCRDNVGGTKLDSGVSCDLEGPDFAENARLLIKCLEEWSNEKAGAALVEICQFLRIVTDLPKDSCQIYRPNDAANSGIISRLMKFA